MPKNANNTYNDKSRPITEHKIQYLSFMIAPLVHALA